MKQGWSPVAGREALWGLTEYDPELIYMPAVEIGAADSNFLKERMANNARVMLHVTSADPNPNIEIYLNPWVWLVSLILCLVACINIGFTCYKWWECYVFWGHDFVSPIEIWALLCAATSSFLMMLYFLMRMFPYVRVPLNYYNRYFLCSLPSKCL